MVRSPILVMTISVPVIWSLASLLDHVTRFVGAEHEKPSTLVTVAESEYGVCDAIVVESGTAWNVVTSLLMIQESSALPLPELPAVLS